MKLTIVEDTIESLGLYERQGNPRTNHQVYDHVSILRKDGQSLMVKRVAVSDEIHRYAREGESGTFAFCRALPLIPGCEMMGIRTSDGREAHSEASLSVAKQFIAFGFLTFLGLCLSIVIVGIPLLLMGLWGLVRAPAWIRRARSELSAHGFELKCVEKF